MDDDFFVTRRHSSGKSCLSVRVYVHKYLSPRDFISLSRRRSFGRSEKVNASFRIVYSISSDAQRINGSIMRQRCCRRQEDYIEGEILYCNAKRSGAPAGKLARHRRRLSTKLGVVLVSIACRASGRLSRYSRLSNVAFGLSVFPLPKIPIGAEVGPGAIGGRPHLDCWGARSASAELTGCARSPYYLLIRRCQYGQTFIQDQRE